MAGITMSQMQAQANAGRQRASSANSNAFGYSAGGYNGLGRPAPMLFTRGSVVVNAGLSIPGAAHDALVQYVNDRCTYSKILRDSYLELYRYIDREFNAYLLKSAEDKQREKDNLRARAVKPTDEKLSMLFAQIDEALTYMLGVLAPDEAIYSAIAPKDQQPIAQGFATLMNRHAEFFQHYRHYALFLLNALRYNCSSYGVDWQTVRGNIVANNATGRPDIKRDQLIEEGNKITAFDPYNTLYDPSVAPVDNNTQGEYFGTVEVHTPFRLMLKQQQNKLYNVDHFLRFGKPGATYYETHPEVRSESLASSGGVTNWVAALQPYASSSDIGECFEVIPFHCWLRPKQFKLGASDKYEIWKIVVGAGSHVLLAEPIDNAHGMLPINTTVPFEDNDPWNVKGAAERLIPMQRFGSFVMNTHQRAVRKKLFGLTFYDATVFPALASAHDELAGGTIPAQNNGADIDLNKKVLHFTDGPDTTASAETVKMVNDMMQQILPTNILQQVAGLDRATQYQAAALVQGANRRNLKIAKIINSQAMDPGRRMQMYNIYQYQQQMQILSNEGELVTVDPKQFRDAKLEFKISDGLKGLDKLSLQLNMKEIFNMILQSQQASSQADVMAMANYLSSLFGDQTDLAQFKLMSPIDRLPADQRNLAFQLLQQYVQQQQAAQQGGAPTGGAPAQ